MGGRGLHVPLVEKRRRLEDEPSGDARRVEANEGSRRPRPDSAKSSAKCAAVRCLKRRKRQPCYHQSHALCGCAPLRIGHGCSIVVAKGLDFARPRSKKSPGSSISGNGKQAACQALYKTVEVGDPIPSALYHAVAEILVLVFRAQSEVRDRDARTRRTAHRIPTFKEQM